MKKIDVKPLHNKIIVQPQEATTMSKGGIIIPDTAKEKPQKGVVVAIGTSKDLVVKVNNEILFGKYAGIEIELNDEKYLIMREDEILAII